MSLVPGSFARSVAAAVALAVTAAGCKKADIPVSAPNPTGLRKEKGYKVRAEPPATPEQVAAYNFLAEDKQKFQEAMDGLPNDAQAPEYCKRLAKYIEYLDSKKPEDLAGLPADMKVNIPKHREGCKKTLAQMKRRPADEGTEFMTTLADLYNRDYEKHTKKYGKDLIEAFREMMTAYVLMVAAAEAAGVESFQ